VKGWQFFLLMTAVVSAPHVDVRTALSVCILALVTSLVFMLVGV